MIVQKAAQALKGEVSVPGDKSISHRGIMFGALAEGTTEVQHFLESADCLATIDCFQKMGIPIERPEPHVVRIQGKGLHGLHRPTTILNAANSGTTLRLLSGILAGQAFSSEITGDASLRTRPMRRILTPLGRMGAKVRSAGGDFRAPLLIEPGELHAIDYQSPVASAQVKSCVLLAGLYADAATSVTEPARSRDHTERMLRAFGASLSVEGKTVRIEAAPHLTGSQVPVPGDISSAAYFIAAALLVPGSSLLLRRVGVNPTRAGILTVCRAMGAHIELLDEHTEAGEPVADLLVTHSALKGTDIGGEIIPTLIDELPVIAVLSAFADGTTTIRDAAELKVKESNRLEIIVSHLSAMGADITPTEDGMIIRGGSPLHGCTLDSHMDHRIAMAFSIAALAADGQTEIANAECINISYPEFYRDLAMCSSIR